MLASGCGKRITWKETVVDDRILKQVGEDGEECESEREGRRGGKEEGKRRERGGREGGERNERKKMKEGRGGGRGRMGKGGWRKREGGREGNRE